MIQSEVSTTDALCAFFASVIIGLIAMPTKTDQVTAGSGLPAPQITFSVIVGSKEVFVYSLLAAVIPFLPILFANHERNVELLATYGAAMRYQAVLGFFVYALNTVCLPVLASAGRREDMILQVRRFYRAIPLVIVAGAMAIGAVILIIPLIDGGKYPKLPLVFLILSGCSLLSLVAVPLINLLLVERQYKQILLCMVLGFIVNLVSYALMRGRLGGYEIATASLLGYVVVNALVMCLGRDRYRRESHRLMT
jgi:O-antigen/teichoic acid export membrane protein